MGVPAFFRWLTCRYPKVIRDAIERQLREVDGRVEPVDLHENPPNGDYDNLYLDMNALIHPCCHPEEGTPPNDEEHMFELIFLFIDRLIRIVRPRRLIYMAVDGVAPRAKMNQQRARRFRAAQEREETEKEMAKLRAEWEADGRNLPSKQNMREPFDSNVITPGTPFFHRFSKAMYYYIHDRAQNDPLWRKYNFQVIFSDCNQPGEGEHKIMKFVRQQRAQPEYDPNTRHMLYGADADLIMLGLSLHETHFYIIREVVVPKNETKCTMCGQSGHVASECSGRFYVMDVGEDEEYIFEQKPFQIVSIPILRQYLARQFGDPLEDALSFPYDFERIVDDFVFFCFFVGNDFLPHLPSLSIRDGSIDQMITLYIELLPEMDDYITDAGVLNLQVTETFLEYLGGIEDQVFKNKLQREHGRKFAMEQARPRGPSIDYSKLKPTQESGPKKLKVDTVIKPKEPVAPKVPTITEKKKTASKEADKPQGVAWHAKLLADSLTMDLDELPDEEEAVEEVVEVVEVTDEVDSKVAEKPSKKRNAAANTKESSNVASFHSTIRARVDQKKDLGAPVEDTVRLGEGANWKQRYYFEKFMVTQEDLVDFIQRIRKAYVEGMCWVLQYYYQGCPSWSWYYPYHYAPFASDLIGMASLKCAERTYFKPGKPFKPIQQLMSVLPPYSAKRAGIPEEMIKLMTDSGSQIMDFFPTDFGLDLNGKRFTWMAVILLPFLDEPRLLRALEPYIGKLSGIDLERNSPSVDLLFGHVDSPLGPALSGKISKELRPLQTKYGPYGFARGKRENETIESPIEGLPDVEKSKVVVTEYELAEDVPHTVQLLEGASFDAQVVTNEDFNQTQFLRGFGGMTAKRMILMALGKNANNAGGGTDPKWHKFREYY